MSRAVESRKALGENEDVLFQRLAKISRILYCDLRHQIPGHELDQALALSIKRNT